MRVRTFVSLAVIFASILAVSGCSPKFACSDDIYNGEPRCSSVTAMYNTKMSGVEDTGPKKKIANIEAQNTDLVEAPIKKLVSSPDQGAEILRSTSYGTKAPLRVPPKIIRIWIAPWEDSDGDLHHPGYVFSEINAKRGRWLFGEKETSGSQPMLKPIERVQDDSEKQKLGQEKPEKEIKPPVDKQQPTLKMK